MFSISLILFVLFILSMVGGFISLALKATWGILKLIGVLIAVIAFPVILIGFIVGIGAFLIIPFVLIMVAFGCIYKAVTA